jgi:hypothetical protein
MTSKFEAAQGHGFAPWIVTFAATSGQEKTFFNATGLPRGWLRSLLQEEREKIFFFLPL